MTIKMRDAQWTADPRRNQGQVNGGRASAPDDADGGGIGRHGHKYHHPSALAQSGAGGTGQGRFPVAIAPPPHGWYCAPPAPGFLPTER
jgi:hypothetical protein